MNNDNDQLLQDFRTYLQALNRTTATVTSYARNVCYYLKYLSETGITVIEATNNDIEKYQGQLVASGVSLCTVETYMGAVKCFYRYLLRQQLILRNPFDLVDPLTFPRHLPRTTLTEKEMVLLLSQPDTKSDKGILHRAIMECFYSSAIRLSELKMLNINDADTAKGILTIIQGKGQKDRFTPLGHTACLWIRAYKELVRSKYVKPNETALFVGLNSGKRIQPMIIQTFISRYAKKAGITKKVSPHVLRATCATHMHRNGASLMEVQEMLGHTLITTTKRYTEITPKDLIEAHRKYHPR